MTFNEWADAHIQQLHDGEFDYEDIWDAAQCNYPFAICDDQMEETLIEDTLNNFDCASEEEASEFINQYGSCIIDDMWDRGSDSLRKYYDYFIEENK